MGYSLKTEKKVEVELTKFDFSSNFSGMGHICDLLPSFGRLKQEEYRIDSNDGYGIPWRDLYEVRDAIVAEANTLTYDRVLSYLTAYWQDRGSVRWSHEPEKNNIESGAQENLEYLREWAAQLKKASEKASTRKDFDDLKLCFY